MSDLSDSDIRQILLITPYRVTMECMNLSRTFAEYRNDESFWVEKAQVQFNLPLPKNQLSPALRYVYLVTNAGGVEFGSEHFIPEDEVLRRAIEQKREDIFNFFISPAMYAYALREAAYQGNLSILENLLKRSTSLPLSEALFAAGESGQLAALRLLLTHAPKDISLTPLLEGAAQGGRNDILTLYLTEQTSIGNALQLAVQREHVATFDLLFPHASEEEKEAALLPAASGVNSYFFRVLYQPGQVLSDVILTRATWCIIDFLLLQGYAQDLITFAQKGLREDLKEYLAGIQTAQPA